LVAIVKSLNRKIYPCDRKVLVTSNALRSLNLKLGDRRNYFRGKKNLNMLHGIYHYRIKKDLSKRVDAFSLSRFGLIGVPNLLRELWERVYCTVPGVVGKSGEVILIGAGLKEAKKKRLGSDHQMTGSELSYQPVSCSF